MLLNMPCLKISTNISKSAIPKDFLEKILPVLSKCVNKAASKFLVTVSTDCLMSVSGTSAPSVIASLESIGNLGPQENKVIAKDLTEFLSKELKVDQNQIFLTFYDLQAYNVAKNGLTVAHMY